MLCSRAGAFGEAVGQAPHLTHGLFLETRRRERAAETSDGSRVDS
jgi:hypothetical protein